jgi:DNA-binding NarL/FixJ family response regulator
MRILVADNQPKVRFALRLLLDRQLDPSQVCEASDAVEALTEAMNTCPDVILLAWDLPGRRDLKLISALQRVCPGVEIIALSGRAESRQAALEAGADAFVCKCDPPEQLLMAIARHVSQTDQPVLQNAKILPH